MKSQASVELTEEVVTLCGWPTEGCSVGWKVRQRPIPPHTLLIFVPGNPGLIKFYTSLLRALVTQLGPGYAAYGVSHAGHSVEPDLANVAQWKGSTERDTSIPWTLEGQILHKAAFVDHVLDQVKHTVGASSPGLIFLSHSIGCFFTQHLLLLRPDILKQAIFIIHLMPFIRAQSSGITQGSLELVAWIPKLADLLYQLMACATYTPPTLVDKLIAVSVEESNARQIVAKVVRQPELARNFLTLGCQEVRYVPKHFETCALRYIGPYCHTAMLFAHNDHWAPSIFKDDLERHQNIGTVPQCITAHYDSRLRHDFVCRLGELAVVIEFCAKQIQWRQSVRPML